MHNIFKVGYGLLQTHRDFMASFIFTSKVVDTFFDEPKWP